MQPDMTQRLRQLQRRAQQLGVLANELSAAVPRSSEGSDTTGYVAVVLGSDGLPAEIRVRDQWQRRLEAGHLGAAVMAADEDAVRAAARAWTASLDDSQWWRRQRDADAHAGEEGTPGSPPSGRPQDDPEFNERVLRALQESRSGAGERAAAPAEGANDGRTVVIRLGRGGLAECVVEPEWARARDGAAITAGLGVALQRAKQRWAKAPRTDLDALVSDALATFTSIVEPPADRGGE